VRWLLCMSFGNARRMLTCEGVGKGTQSDRLLKRYPQLSSISSGDLLRDNVRQKTPLGTVPVSDAASHSN